MDDIRIYNRSLSVNEITYLAGQKVKANDNTIQNLPIVNRSVWSFSADKSDSKINETFGDLEAKGIKYVADRFANPDSAIYFSNYAHLSSINSVSELPYWDKSRTYTFWTKCITACTTPYMTLIQHGGIMKGKKSSISIGSWYAPYCGQINFYTAADNLLMSRDRSLSSVCDNTWRFVAITYDGFKSQLYIDGTLISDFMVMDLMHTKNTTITLGWSGNLAEPTYGNSFTGAIDDIKIYDFSLSATEIVQVYRNLDKPLLCSNQSYAFLGSPACSKCSSEDLFVSPFESCRPNAKYGPSDTIYYLSCDASEGLASFGSFDNPGITYISDRFDTANSAIYVSSNTYLATPPLPILPSQARPSTISFWIKCPWRCSASRTIFTYGEKVSYMSFFHAPRFVGKSLCQSSYRRR